MGSQEYSVGAQRAFAVMVVAVIVVVAIVSYTVAPGVEVVSSSASSASAAQSSTFYSTTSPLGLRLQAQLNTSTFQSGSVITAQIAVFNTLDQNLSLTPIYTANSTILSWNDYDFFCGASGSPLLRMVSYALFQGNFAAANFSLAGSPLQLAPRVAISCVTGPEPDSITFLPENDSVVLSTPSGGVTLGRAAVSASTQACTSPASGDFDYGPSRGLSGYWNATGIPSGSVGCEVGSKYFTYFPAGEYTLAVEDIWNQTLYTHFQVTSVGAMTSSSSTASASTSAASELCYQGAVPANASASGGQSTYGRSVFNVTRDFDSWSWTSLSTFKVGSYAFVATNPAATAGVNQLEPQLFFKVTNSQGQTQETSVTNLGDWNGQGWWPPDMSLEQTLFGGNVTIRWLFPCDGESVFLDVTTQ